MYKANMKYMLHIWCWILQLDLIPFVSFMRCNVVCKMLICCLRAEVVRVIIFPLELKVFLIFSLI